MEQLQQYGVIKSKKVAEVMETIDRGLFVPEGNPPYMDSPMPVGYNATISAPHMHATCLELLKEHLQPGMRALDVGSGNNYIVMIAYLILVMANGCFVFHYSFLDFSVPPELEKLGCEILLKSLADNSAVGTECNFL